VIDPLTAIIVLSPCAMVTILLCFFVAIRYIAYRERIALAQHGIFLPDQSLWERIGQRSPRGILWAGVLTAMCGLALLLGLALIGIGPWLLGGLIPLFVGAGMVVVYFLGGGVRERDQQRAGVPPTQESGTEHSG